MAWRAVLIGILAAPCLLSQGVGSGNQIISVPAGWTWTDVPAGTLLTPSAAKNLVTILLSGSPLGGRTFREAFDGDFKGLSAGQRMVCGGPLMESRRAGDGIEILAITAEMRQTDSGVPSYRHYLAANPPGRIEMLVYMASRRDLFQQYWPDVRRFVAAWRFANAGASPRTPSAPPASRRSDASSRLAGGVLHCQCD